MKEEELSLRDLECILIEQLLDQYYDPEDPILSTNRKNAESILNAINFIEKSEEAQQVLRDHIKNIGGVKNLEGWEAFAIDAHDLEHFEEVEEERRIRNSK